jgi:hypothetical protein
MGLLRDTLDLEFLVFGLPAFGILACRRVLRGWVGLSLRDSVDTWNQDILFLESWKVRICRGRVIVLIV